MGDPRRIRSKYQGPRHPWNKGRIEREKTLMYNYGLSNKKELWKVESVLKTFKDNIKKLSAQTSKQADIEKNQLFTKLRKLGIIGAQADADDILGLETEALLDRRLQTIVFKQEHARSTKQARQFITHGHILIGDKKVSVPGYIVPVSEEANISFNTKSSLFNPEHPERAVTQKTAVREQGTESAPVIEVKSEEAKAEETAPAIETSKTPEKEKPIEQKIEEETSDVKEVAEAIKVAEADEIAVDEEQEVKDEGAEQKAAQQAEEIVGSDNGAEKVEEVTPETKAPVAEDSKKGDA